MGRHYWFHHEWERVYAGTMASPSHLFNEIFATFVSEKIENWRLLFLSEKIIQHFSRRHQLHPKNVKFFLNVSSHSAARNERLQYILFFLCIITFSLSLTLNSLNITYNILFFLFWTTLLRYETKGELFRWLTMWNVLSLALFSISLPCARAMIMPGGGREREREKCYGIWWVRREWKNYTIK